MNPRPRHLARTVIWVVGVSLWIGLPFLGLWRAGRAPDARKLTGNAPLQTVRVRANVGPISSPAGLALTWAASGDLVAPAWSGLVESVAPGPGSTIRSGDVVADIDSVRRIAAHSLQPFRRQIAVNDSGPDVLALNRLLADLGLAHAAGDQATTNTMLGVRALGARAGIAAAPAFDPAWLVYMPRAELRVSTVEIRVGAPAPTAGQTIFKVVPSLAAARPISADSLNGTLARGTNGLQGESTSAQLPGIEVPAGSELRIGDASLQLDATRRSVLPESFPAIERSVEGQPVIVKAAIARVNREGEVRVPASAVLLDAKGTYCVFQVSRGDVTSHQVVVAAESNGQVVVTGRLRSGDVVLARLRSTETRCDSS